MTCICNPLSNILVVINQINKCWRHKVMQIPSFSLAPEKNSCSCIIDPALALSYYGVPLVKRLATVIELWVVRELWHILNDCDFYLQQPELLIPKTSIYTSNPEQERAALEEKLWSLKEWQKSRFGNDLAGLNIFWLGDSLHESLLPKNQNYNIFWQWESFAKSLEYQIDQFQQQNSVLLFAFRDTAALTACLESAFILTYQLPDEFTNNTAPGICQTLQSWGFSCKFLPAHHAYVAIERDYWHQLFANTGLTKFFWSGLHLIVLHLVVPRALSTTSSPIFQASNLSSRENSVDDLESNNLWAGSQAFWYQI